MQLSWQLSQQDKRWICERSYQKSLADGKVEFFFYDTCPFVQRYYQQKWANNIGRCFLDSFHSFAMHASQAQKAQLATYRDKHFLLTNLVYCLLVLVPFALEVFLCSSWALKLQLPPYSKIWTVVCFHCAVIHNGLFGISEWLKFEIENWWNSIHCWVLVKIDINISLIATSCSQKGVVCCSKPNSASCIPDGMDSQQTLHLSSASCTEPTTMLPAWAFVFLA